MMSKSRSRCHRIEADKGNSRHDGTDTLPTDIDVLCGRGRTNFHHRGNERFRDIVGRNLQTYISANSRSKKTKVVHAITDEIIMGGTRFLKQDRKTLQWFEAGIVVAREKVGHALRDATSDKSRAIEKIHLDHQNLTTTANKSNMNKKRRHSASTISVIKAQKVSFFQASDPAEETLLALEDTKDGDVQVSPSNECLESGSPKISALNAQKRSILDATRPQETDAMRVALTDTHDIGQQSPDSSVLSFPAEQEPRVLEDDPRVCTCKCQMLRSMYEETNLTVAVPIQADIHAEPSEYSAYTDSLFSDDLLRELVNLPSRTNPSPNGSLDDYLDAVNEIELDNLEAYMSHALGTTSLFVDTQ